MNIFTKKVKKLTLEIKNARNNIPGTQYLNIKISITYSLTIV